MRAHCRVIRGAAEEPRQRSCRNYERRDRQARQRIETDGWSGVAFYRKYTIALLRRYLRVAMQVGRVPSCMQRDVFCGRATSYQVRGFEDGVIFVQDIERCLATLDSLARRVIETVVLQDYSQVEVADQMGYSLRQMNRLVNEALDTLTDVLLERQLLDLGQMMSRA